MISIRGLSFRKVPLSVYTGKDSIISKWRRKLIDALFRVLLCPCPYSFFEILCHSITNSFASIGKHDTQEWYMPDSCITPVYLCITPYPCFVKHTVFFYLASILITTDWYVIFPNIRVSEPWTSGCRGRQHPGVWSLKMGVFLYISACFSLFSCLFSVKMYLM